MGRDEYGYKCQTCGQRLSDDRTDNLKTHGWKWKTIYGGSTRIYFCCKECMEKYERAIVTVSLDSIVNLDETQARVETSTDKINEYQSVLTDGGKFPPIEVVEATDVPGVYYIVDGIHRFYAYKRAGIAELDVAVFGKGTLQDAIWQAASANQRHGLPRTKEDIRNAIRHCLTVRPDATNAQIAEHLGGKGVCSEWMVRDERARLVEGGTLEPTKKPSELAEEALTDPANQGKSVRQIAAESDGKFTEGTVRKVRKNSESKKLRTAGKAGELDAEEFDPQRRPTIAKVTAETKRVKPEVEKPSEPVTITRRDEFREQWTNRHEFLIGESEPLNDIFDKLVIALEDRPGLLLALRDKITEELEK